MKSTIILFYCTMFTASNNAMEDKSYPLHETILSQLPIQDKETYINNLIDSEVNVNEKIPGCQQHLINLL